MPGGIELVGRIGGDLLEIACRERQRPHVVAAAAVRRERDLPAVGRPDGLAIVVRSRCQWLQIGAVGSDGPDLPGGGPIRLKRDVRPVRRPRRLPRIHRVVGNRPGHTAGRGHRPQGAEQIDGDGPAVGRKRRGHRCAFVQRQVHVTAARRRAVDDQRQRNAGRHRNEQPYRRESQDADGRPSSHGRSVAAILGA